MKRKLLILSVLVICVATLAAGTLAFFTSDEMAHNVITTGKVKITLNEWADADKTKPFEDLEGIMPGMEVTKIAEVKNTGASPAWVRVKITTTVTDKDGKTLPAAPVVLNISSAWTPGGDGYYYYNKALAPNEVTEPVFTTVTFEKTMGNEYQNAKAVVDVAAQAVQTANNGATVQDAKGWPGTDTGVTG